MSDMWPTPRAGDKAGQSKNATIQRVREGGDVMLSSLLKHQQEFPDLFFSQADSPVSPSHRQDEEAARKMTATSGRKWFGLLKSSGPLGCLVRTLLASSRWMTFSTRYLLTWEGLGTTLGRQLFRLRLSERRTDETGSGLWATPNTFDSLDLRNENPTENNGKNLRQDIHRDGSTGGSLNPDWVESLMGYPQGWTDTDGPPLMTFGRRQEQEPPDQENQEQAGKS